MALHLAGIMPKRPENPDNNMETSPTKTSKTSKTRLPSQKSKHKTIFILITYLFLYTGDDFGSVEDLLDPDITIPSKDTSLEEGMGEDGDDHDGEANMQNGEAFSQARDNNNPTTPATDASETPGPSNTGGTHPQSTPGAGFSDLFSAMPSSTQEEKDEKEQLLDERRVLVALKGGIGSNNPPDPTKMRARQGQDLDIINSLLDLDDFDPSAIPVCPDEASLPRLDSKDLRPPPSSKPLPLDSGTYQIQIPSGRWARLKNSSLQQ